MNLLQTIEKLAVEANAEGTRRDKQIEIIRGELVSVKADHETLLTDYDQLHDDCKAAEQSASLCKVSNKGLLKELAEKDLAIKAIEETNTILSDRDRLLQAEIDRLKGIERENQVLKNDNKKLKAQVVRHQQVKPIKAPKVTRSYKQLKQAYEESQNHIVEMAKHLERSPQTEGVFKHSTQGFIDLYRLNSVLMTIDRNGNGPVDVEVERMIVMNSYNSCKVITRINGEPELGKVTLPKGGVISVDEEMLKWSLECFEANDKNKALLKKSTEAKKAA